MDKRDFYFDLPSNLIAQVPISDRSASRLLVMDKFTGATEHRIFRDITEYISPGDCLVINDTRVIPARLTGIFEDSGGRIELLLLSRKSGNTWETLVKPGKKAKIGRKMIFGDGVLSAKVVETSEDGNRIVEFDYNKLETFEAVLDRLGEIPLPPYITEKLADSDRYQTVFAKNNGSAAAPTAGLHFTNQILDELTQKNVSIAKITLHVGLGTFRPVKTDNLDDHIMHSEFYNIEMQQADIINNARRNGGKIIAVGTTSCRSLESCSDESGILCYGSGWTDIFIRPGYKFKIVDRLITNFHLPESTLIMLVSALSSRQYVLDAYKEAIGDNYRFFSFGDAMFIGDWSHIKRK